MSVANHHGLLLQVKEGGKGMCIPHSSLFPHIIPLSMIGLVTQFRRWGPSGACKYNDAKHDGVKYPSRHRWAHGVWQWGPIKAIQGEPPQDDGPPISSLYIGCMWGRPLECRSSRRMLDVDIRRWHISRVWMMSLYVRHGSLRALNCHRASWALREVIVIAKYVNDKIC